MKEKRMTIERDLVRIATLSFGEIELNRKQVEKRFDPKQGYIWLQGTNLLLDEDEVEEIKVFLAM